MRLLLIPLVAFTTSCAWLSCHVIGGPGPGGAACSHGDSADYRRGYEMGRRHGDESCKYAESIFVGNKHCEGKRP